jgi:hypothetical protein
MNKKNNDYYDKKIDIELKRKALSEKYGAHFGETNTELPAEIEEAWLNSVEKIERQYENAKSTTVWEYIGKPAYRKITELNQNEISASRNNIADYCHYIEVGGKNKGMRQIQEVDNAYVVKDDIEQGFLNTIPLWQFGFMY